MNRDRWWLALLWGAAVLFFWPVLFGGRSLYFRDTLSHYIPQALLTAKAWRAGELPLWEPRLGLGYPLLADPHAMACYPPALLMLALPFPRSYDALVVLHVPLAGTFLFLLLRRWKLGAPAAALGALALMFSGYTITLVSLTTLLKGLTWMPAALLAFDGVLAGGGAPCVIATALVLAIQGSGTDPQYVLFTGLLLAVARWLRPLPARIGAARTVLDLAVAGGLALVVLAYQYLPLAELIGQSDRLGGLGAGERALYAVSPIWLLTTVVPVAFPDPAHPLHLLSFPGAWQPMLTDLYLGVALVALALGALGRAGEGSEEDARPGRTALVAAALAAGGIAMALGDSLGLSTLLTRLIPPLAKFRFASKYYLFSGLSLPVLAALGFDGLARGSRRCGAVLAAGLVALALALGAGLAALGSAGLAAPFHYLQGGPGIEGDLTPALHALLDAWTAGVRTALLEVVVLAALAALWLAGRLRPALFLAALWLFAAGDLTSTSLRDAATVPDAVLSAPPAALRLLTSPGPDPARFATYMKGVVAFSRDHTAQQDLLRFRELMRFLTGAAYGANPLFVNPSVRLASQDAMEDAIAAVAPEAEARLLARLGVRYFLGTEPAGLGSVVGRAGGVVVEALPDPSPRAFVPRRATPLSSGPVTPTTAALLDLAAAVTYEMLPGERAGPPRTAAGRCSLARYEDRRLTVDLEADGPALVVVLDGFYPGWQAQVDGHPRPVRRVAGLFRGVEVDRGDRRLEMEYRPASFRAGAITSAAALLACLGVIVLKAIQAGRTYR